jgi:hypothetical protein
VKAGRNFRLAAERASDKRRIWFPFRFSRAVPSTSPEIGETAFRLILVRPETPRMPIDIAERYKLIFEEHHYASSVRIKIFTGWCVMYAGLAAALGWLYSTSQPLTWVATASAVPLTAMMWFADIRNRSALRASKEAGRAIELDDTAGIPPAQRFFTRLKATTVFERSLTHSRVIDAFSIIMVAFLLLSSWYLYSHGGNLPQRAQRPNQTMEGTPKAFASRLADRRSPHP